MPPVAIAVELGWTDPEFLSSSAAASLAAWRVASITPTAEQAAEGLRALAKGGAPLDAVVADLSRPARIRAWALEQGLQVSAVGPIRRAVIEAYDAEHSVAGTDLVPEHTELRGTSDEPKQPPIVVDLPNPASAGSITVETVQEVPELTVPPAPARPDFGQAMADVDVERARRIAVHLEQELAEAERQRDEAIADVHTLTTALAREQQVAASAEAEASALRRSIADARARRGRGLGGLVRRMVSR
ncbi:hypothetical protein [uncultured Microbacterium sp.]|uniref:Lsr2 family DNA-binding protein n=1 Tax=uncultured Microbacterium sp. TaxID=191216 RepID=UPI0025FC2A0F|nr:hypothetical protein [uncultured Microbacterium sp.]